MPPAALTEKRTPRTASRAHAHALYSPSKGYGAGPDRELTLTLTLRPKGTALVRDRELVAELPTWYVPQIQLEILCCGEHCRSAVLVRLTATRGAVIVRVARDDAFITLMLRRFVRFCRAFLHLKKPRGPPPDLRVCAIPSATRCAWPSAVRVKAGSDTPNSIALSRSVLLSDHGEASLVELIKATLRVAASGVALAAIPASAVQRSHPRDDPLLVPATPP